jgi:hypothetical protein
MSDGGTEEETGVRATRRINRERAPADGVPGVTGGYGTTSDGQDGRSAPRAGRGGEGS